MSRNFHPVNANSPSTTTLTSDHDIDPSLEDNSNNNTIIQPYLFPPGVSTNTSFNSNDQTLVDNCSNIEVSQLVTEANRFWGNCSTTIPSIETGTSAAEYPATYRMGNYDHGYGDQNMHETSVPYGPCDHFQVAGTGMDMGMRIAGMKGEDEDDMYNANQASMLAALGMTHLDEGGSHAVDDDAKTSSSVTVDDDPEWKEWKKWNETDANGGVRLPSEERMDQAGVATWVDIDPEERKTNEGFMSSKEKMDQAGVAAWLDMNHEEDHGVFQHEEEDDYDEDETTSYGSDDDMMEMGEETEYYEEEEEVVNVVEGPSRQVLISSQTGAVAEYDTASFGCDFEAEEEEKEEEQHNEERWGGDRQPRPSPFPCFYDARSGLIIDISSSESDAEETMSDPSSDDDVEETMSDPSSSSTSSSSSPTSENPQAYALPWPTSPSNLSTSTTTSSTSASTPTETSPPPSSQPVRPSSSTPFTLLADLHTHLSSAPNHRATHLRNLANEISNTMYFVNSRTISGDFSAEDAAPVDRVMRIVREGELKMRYQERYERQKGKLVKRERRVAEREDRVSKREEMRTVRVTREVVRRMDKLIDESEINVDGDCDVEGGVEL
ncbi:similar to An08g08700 [Aspergillus luchuensis IFO 4308]|nr:similar to An08g08700 [Aspergillus luchuensis IFO 4308]